MTQRKSVSFRRVAKDGMIIATYPLEGHTLHKDTLMPFVKPSRPLEVDTPIKRAKWDAYWDKISVWWEEERLQQRRNRR